MFQKTPTKAILESETKPKGYLKQENGRKEKIVLENEIQGFKNQIKNLQTDMSIKGNDNFTMSFVRIST